MLNWGEDLFGLIIPEGVVHRVRHGATVLWNSIRRSIRSTLAVRQQYHAQPRQAETAPAEGGWKGRLAPQAEETALASSPAKGEEPMKVHLQGQAHKKAASFGAGRVRCELEQNGRAHAGRSAPAEQSFRLDTKITGGAHGPGTAPARSARGMQITTAGRSAQSAAKPVQTEKAVQYRFCGDGTGTDSTPAEALARTRPFPRGEAAVRDAENAVSALPPLMSILAEPRAAEGWVYPKQSYSYMILDRVAGAVVYDARSGGKGLEVS